MLVQPAWSYRHKPKIGTALKLRQQGQPAWVITHARKAQHRLYKLYHHLAYQKQPQIAAVAVARELVEVLRAAMREVEPMCTGTTPVN